MQKNKSLHSLLSDTNRGWQLVSSAAKPMFLTVIGQFTSNTLAGSRLGVIYLSNKVFYLNKLNKPRDFNPKSRFPALEKHIKI